MKVLLIFGCFLLFSCSKVVKTTSVIDKEINCEDCLVTKEKTAVGIAESPASASVTLVPTN